MATVWAFVEQDGQGPTTLGLELLAKARELGETTALLLGAGSDSVFAALGEHGATRGLHLHPGADLPSAPLAAALAERARSDSPDLILLGQAYNDRDIAGRLAARLGVGVLF